MAAPKKKPFVADPNLAKENMVKALGLLQQAVATVATPEGIRAHLAFSARGNLHRYSVRNQLLIRQQCPGATEVGGYHYWIKRGRRPLKGEGCRIFAPSIYTKRVEVDPTDPEAPQVLEQNPDGTTDHTVVVERIMRGWRTLVVWDISKTTDARGNAYVPTAGPAMPAGSTSGFLGSDDEDERAAGIDQFLRDWLGDQGVRVVTALLRPGLYGSWQGATNVLTCSNRYDPITTCSSTVHEAAHFLVDRDKHQPGTYNAEELVAEGVAYIVLMRYGLDTSKFSFGYVKQYGADTKTYQKVLGILQKVAAVVVAALETEAPADEAGEEQEQAA